MEVSINFFSFLMIHLLVQVIFINEIHSHLYLSAAMYLLWEEKA